MVPILLQVDCEHKRQSSPMKKATICIGYHAVSWLLDVSFQKVPGWVMLGLLSMH